MKKILISFQGNNYSCPKKFLMIMKLTYFLVFFNLLNISAIGYSQVEKITVELNKSNLKELVKAVEKQTQYKFLYRDDELEGLTVNLNAVNTPLDEVLTRSLKGSDFDYKILANNLIVITSNEVLQQQNISGKVTDISGAPLPGVSVVVKGTTTGTVTDINGRFTLDVPADADVLVFSFVGMATQEVNIGKNTEFNIVLKEAELELDEVIVIGYGTQRKATLTGSVTTVNSDFIQAKPLTNSTQALQGALGVYVNQAGGQPGNDVATIRIRGVGTLNNNDPLVLVDGVPANMRDVNPNDIESISVLKDATSASIYGNRAANGVILITTKTGKKEHLKIELNTYAGWQEATYLLDMVTNSIDYMNARNQASINELQPVPYSADQVEEYRNGTDPDIYPNSDWYGLMFSAAPIQDYNLRLSGGTEMVTFSLSLDYLNQDGVLLGTDAKKYSLNSNVIYKGSDRLQIGAIISGSFWDRNESYTGAESLMQGIARSLPIYGNIRADGRYGETWLTTPGHNTWTHPVATALEGGQNNKTQNAVINMFAEYRFPMDIKYKINFSVNKYDGYTHIFRPRIEKIHPKTLQPKYMTTPRSVTRSNNSNLNTSFFQTLNWTKKIADHHDVNLLFGFSMESFYNSNFNAYIEGFLGDELPELNAGTINKDVGGKSSKSTLMSYFGRVNYTLSDKYLFEFNFRYDGSSRFAPGRQWGLFPSLSAGWRIAEEAFMENIETISNLKLRLSWGQLGNQQISLYSFLNQININQGTTFNNQNVAGSAVTTLSDPDISWETTTISNIGLDLGLWNDRLEFNLDVFNKVTTEILARINIPGQVGDLTGPITNLYGMSNKGFELSATHRNTIGKLTYRIGGSIAYVDNNVDYLSGDIQYTTNAYGRISVIQEGYPVNSWYLYEAEGIFQTEEEIANHAFQHTRTSPGDIKYRDINDDKVIDGKDMRVMGRSVPKYTYSFNMNADYKGFDMDAFFQGVQGIDIYPWHNVSWPLFNGAGITKYQLANSWTPENPDAPLPRLSLYKRGTQINAQNSTFWLKDASYLRLKNIQIGYTLRDEWTSRIKISKIRAYINAQNLLTFSKYKVTDPEKNILGQNIFDYPTTKIFTIGLNLVF